MFDFSLCFKRKTMLKYISITVIFCRYFKHYMCIKSHIIFQTIHATEVDSGLDGFGISFAEYYPYKSQVVERFPLNNNDVDQNQYPGMLHKVWKNTALD